jgi:hypothetical protein
MILPFVQQEKDNRRSLLFVSFTVNRQEVINIFFLFFDESNPKVRFSGALKRGIRKVIERLTTGFTAVALSFYLSSTCFNHVFSKSHNRMAVAM